MNEINKKSMRIHQKSEINKNLSEIISEELIKINKSIQNINNNFSQINQYKSITSIKKINNIQLEIITETSIKINKSSPEILSENLLNAHKSMQIPSQSLTNPY